MLNRCFSGRAFDFSKRLCPIYSWSASSGVYFCVGRLVSPSPRIRGLRLKDCRRDCRFCAWRVRLGGYKQCCKTVRGEFYVRFRRILLDSLTEGVPCPLAVHDRHFVCDDVASSMTETGQARDHRECSFILLRNK